MATTAFTWDTWDDDQDLGPQMCALADFVSAYDIRGRWSFVLDDSDGSVVIASEVREASHHLTDGQTLSWNAETSTFEVSGA